MPAPEGSFGPVPLTSVSTTWFTRVVPVAVTLITGAIAAAAWLGLLGDEVDLAAKSMILGVAIVVSGVSHGWFGQFKRVWLDGESLVIGGDPRRGVRISLRDVAHVGETRWQKLKWIKVELARSTPVGDTIRFIPRGHEAWLTPWLSSPVAAELKGKVRALKSPDGAQR